ncbi:MAG: hypothetical protein PHI73_00815 [Patescibacteria group bacterium]|nr:hypothetical protein [Patescibacteria group bacterium]
MPTAKTKKTIKRSQALRVRVVKEDRLTRPEAKANPPTLIQAQTQVKKENKIEKPGRVFKQKQYAWIGATASFVIIMVAWLTLGQYLPGRHRSNEADQSLKSLGNLFSKITTDFDQHAEDIRSQIFGVKNSANSEEIVNLEQRVFPQFNK